MPRTKVKTDARIRFELLDLNLEENHELGQKLERLMDRECGGCAGDYVVRAFRHWDLRTVGYWTFTVDPEGWINSNGTWVHSLFRRQRIAQKMWAFGLTNFPEMKEIYLQTTSLAGVRFAEKLKLIFRSRREFFVEDVSGHDTTSCSV